MHGYLSQGLRRAVQINRSGIATIFGERRRTWGEVLERVRRFAGALRALGLSEGGRVAMLGLNSDDYLELHYAIPWAGGVLVPINTRLAAAEVRYILDDATPEIIVCDDACLPLLERGRAAAQGHDLSGRRYPAERLACLRGADRRRNAGRRRRAAGR